MKNSAKYLILLAVVFFDNFTKGATADIVIGYLHDKVLEDTVPELKEFNARLTHLFRIKDPLEKSKATKGLFNFFSQARQKLSYEMKSKKMTLAQVKATKIVLDVMKRKLANYGFERIF